VTVKKLFENTTMYSKTRNWGANHPHNSGTIKVFNMLEFGIETLPSLLLARIYFEVDPNDKVDESDEGNNVVWTYIFLWWIQFLQWNILSRIILGRLRQR